MEKLEGLNISGAATFYEKLLLEAKALIDGEDDLVANTANVSALVYNALNERKTGHVNWARNLPISPPPPLLLSFEIFLSICVNSFAKKGGILFRAWQSSSSGAWSLSRWIPFPTHKKKLGSSCLSLLLIPK